MRRLPFVLLPMLASLAWAGAPARAQQATQAPQALPEVLVGMGLPKPPYIMESGTAGLDYDLARLALAAGGYKLVAQMLPQARALSMLRTGQLDGMLSITEGIGGQDYFTDNYVIYQNYAMTLTRRNLKLEQIEDLTNHSVAAFQNASMVLGDRYSFIATGHPNYIELHSQVAQNKLLYSGRVEVVVGDRHIFRYFNEKLGSQFDTSQPVTFHRIFPENPRRAVFRDSRVRDAFNNGLKTIRSNGTYDAVMKQYLGASR